MKILIITSGILPMPPSKGGAVENLLLSFIEYNEQMKKDELVILSCKDEAAEKWACKYSESRFVYIDTNRCLFKIKKCFRYAWNKITGFKVGNAFVTECKRYIAVENPDAIIIENMPLFVVPLRSITEKPIYLHLHNDTLNSRSLNNKEIVSACTEIWAVSDFIANQVKSIDVNKSNVCTLLNGLDTNRFKPFGNSRRIRTIREKYNISEKDFVILYTGRIALHKGVRELIEAFNSLENKNNSKLLIVGSSFFGIKSTDSIITELKEISKERKNDIIFTGYIPYENMSSIYNIADLVVLPSIWNEPCALTVIESLLCEKPLISTKAGGTPQICDGTKSVLLDLNENLTDELINRIDDLIENPEKLDDMSKSCRAVKHRLSVERYLMELDNLIH